MNKILQDLMIKKGVTPESMTDDEKQTFDRYNTILSEKEASPESIAQFCVMQRGMIENKWQNSTRDRQHDTYLADMHAVYGLLIKLIKSKKVERIALEEQLQQMLDTPS